MLRHLAVVVVYSAAAVFAADDPSSTTSQSPSSTSSSKNAPTHTVKVGWPIGEHAFEPEVLEADPGDFIQFEMYPANHSVSQMDPSAPCIPLYYAKQSVKESESYWTGFYPVKDVKKPKKAPIYKVNDEEPLYFYCTAPDSCTKYGMVMAVNAKEGKSDLIDVQSRAKAADYALSPGEPIPSEGESPSSSSSPSSSATSQPANTSEAANSGSHHGLSAGAIAGIVIGAVGAFGIVGLLFFFIGRRKKVAPAPPAAPAPDTVENPPMYQDPRYSAVPSSPAPWNDGAAAKQGHASMLSTPETFEERNPHRLSELASQNYDPVEIYTPGLPEHQELESPGHPPASPRNLG